MNEIICYIDQNFYKNNDIYNLKLINKYIKDLKELKEEIIHKKRHKINYKYDINDIFKYIDTNLFDDNNIKTLKTTTKVIKKSIKKEEIEKKREEILWIYYPDIYKISIINHLIGSSYTEGSSLKTENENINLIFTGVIYNNKNNNIYKKIEEIEEIGIYEYYSWKNEKVLDILYDKYILEYINEEIYIIISTLSIYEIYNENVLLIEDYEIDINKTFTEQFNWNFIKYLTYSNKLGYLITIEISIAENRIFETDKRHIFNLKEKEPDFNNINEKYNYIKENKNKYINTKSKKNIYINNYNRTRYFI
tara:strand:- start:1435 stop:2355 length:921 start_codon:yes stop_codon:yes gene_type:complete